MKVTTWIIILASCLVVTLANDFDPATVRLIKCVYAADNQAQFNCLFRSNIPISNGEFNYDYVTDTMKRVALVKDVLITDENLYIVDISLLHPDDSHLSIERDFFKANPSKGKVINYPLLGETEDPSKYSESEIIAKSQDLSWMTDDLQELVDLIDNQLNNFSKGNRMVLIHCQHGHDRAGESSGAYWLTRAHRSWEQVSATNWEIAGHQIVYNNQRALTWYCHHLQYHAGYTHLTCTHENLNSQTIVEPLLLGWDQPPASESSESVDWFEVFFPVFVGSIGVLCCVLWILTVFLGVVIYRRKSAKCNTPDLARGSPEVAEQTTKDVGYPIEIQV